MTNTLVKNLKACINFLSIFFFHLESCWTSQGLLLAILRNTCSSYIWVSPFGRGQMGWIYLECHYKKGNFLVVLSLETIVRKQGIVLRLLHRTSIHSSLLGLALMDNIFPSSLILPFNCKYPSPFYPTEKNVFNLALCL